MSFLIRSTDNLVRICTTHETAIAGHVRRLEAEGRSVEVTTLDGKIDGLKELHRLLWPGQLIHPAP